MEKNHLNRLMTIVSFVLMIAGFIFLCISIWGSSKTNTPLVWSLGCISVANLLNIIRWLRNRDK